MWVFIKILFSLFVLYWFMSLFIVYGAVSEEDGGGGDGDEEGSGKPKKIYDRLLVTGGIFYTLIIYGIVNLIANWIH